MPPISTTVVEMGSNHWKRTLKIIFKGSGCFQFPEAVVTSTVKESLRSTKHGSLQVLTVL